MSLMAVHGHSGYLTWERGERGEEEEGEGGEEEEEGEGERKL